MGHKIQVRIGKGKATVSQGNITGEMCLLNPTIQKLKQAYGGKSEDLPTDDMFKAPESDLKVNG